MKIYISYQVLHKQQEAQLLLSNAEISLQFIIRLKSFRVGAFLSSVCLSIRQYNCLSNLSVGTTVLPSVHSYYTPIQSVWLSICSVCSSVHSDSAHQSICHFKGQFDPTDRNYRTSESIINKYSSQTDYPSVCSPSIHSVHPSSWQVNLSADLSIQSIRPSDGRSDIFFLFGKKALLWKL